MDLKGKKGVDISYANGDIDLAKVKKAGYDFVMIRCGYGNDEAAQDDAYFSANVAKAEKLGMPWGTYLFSYALSAADAESEAAHVDRLLRAERKKGHYPALPVALDVEPSDYVEENGGWNSKNINNVTTVFLNAIQKRGYYPMLYTGYEELDNLLSDYVRDNFDCWFAQWSSKPSAYKYKRLGMWQYGGEENCIDGNSIPGVGMIDKDICYRDYPTIIKNGGYNGFQKPQKPKTLDAEGFRKGDKGPGVYALKSLLMLARQKGVVKRKLDDNGIFGAGTQIAVNEVLAHGNYRQNGVAGEKTIAYLRKLLQKQ